MAVLSGQKIKELMLNTGREDGRLFITPLLDIKQITKDGVDIRLGNYFIISKRTEYPSIDVSKDRDVRQFQQKIFVPLGQNFFLMPKSFALGVTVEYVKLPTSVCCEVVTRSTWGRLGLIIATAVWVHPCFAGCLTLELVNDGDIPIALSPGMMVGTLVFHEVKGGFLPESTRNRKYDGLVLPEFSRIDSEKEELKRLQDIGKGLYPQRNPE